MIKFLSYPSKYCIYGLVALAMFIGNSLVANTPVHQDKTDKVFTVTDAEFLAATQNAQSLLAGNRALFSELGRIKRKSNLQDIIIGRLTQENAQLRRALYKANQSYSTPMAFNQTQTPTSSNTQVAHGTTRTMPVNVSASLSSFNDRNPLSDIHLVLNNSQVKALELSLSFVPTLPFVPNDLEVSSAQSRFHLPVSLETLSLPLQADLTATLSRPVFTGVHVNQEETESTIIQNAFEPTIIQDSAFMLSNPEAEPELADQSTSEIEPLQVTEIAAPPSLSLTIIQPEQVLENESTPLPSLQTAQAIVESTFVPPSPVAIAEPDLPPVVEIQPESVPTTSEFRSAGLADEETGEAQSQTIEDVDVDAGAGIEAAAEERQQPQTIIEAIRSELAAIPQFIDQLIGVPSAPVEDNLALVVEETTLGIPSSLMNIQGNLARSRQPDDELLNLSPIPSEPVLNLAQVMRTQTNLPQNVLGLDGQNSLQMENERLRREVADLESELQEMRVSLTESNDIGSNLIAEEPYDDEFEASLRNINLGKLNEDHREELARKISTLTLEKETLLEKIERLNLEFDEVKRENEVLNTSHKKLSQAFKELKQKKKAVLETPAEKTPKHSRRLFMRTSKESNSPELDYLQEANQDLTMKTQKFVRETSPSLRGKITELNLINSDFKETIEAQNFEIEALSTKNQRLKKETDELRKNNHLLSKKNEKLRLCSKRSDEDFNDVRDLFLWFNDQSLPQPKLLQLMSEEMRDFMHKMLSKSNKHIQPNDDTEEKMAN